MRKPIITVIILLVLAIITIFSISMQRNTPIIIVEVTLARPPDNNSEHIITNVNASLSYAGKMEVPEETSLLSPGITVFLIQDMQPQSGWYSVGLPSNASIYENYSITVRPYKSFNISRPFVVNTRVLDSAGKEISVRRTDYKII